MKDLFLAIESSCDDSSVAVININTFECLFHQTLSQQEHSIAGGVVPELASRLHTAALPKLIAQTKQYFPRLVAIGATTEPGLSVSLQSGVACAKALCANLALPFIAINHLKGHICSLFLDSKPPKDFLCLLVSGGHTQIISVTKGRLKILASTSDDSLGESFDKTSKMLGGPYPGGAWVSANASAFKARENELKALDEDVFKEHFDYSFSVPLIAQKNRLEYSFSGLKNQVRLQSAKLASSDLSEDLRLLARDKICYEFERASIAHIIDKLKPFLATTSALGIVGGASANARLRSELEALCAALGIKLMLAPLKYCSDNALMIARAGLFKLERKEFSALNEAVIHPKSSEFSML